MGHGLFMPPAAGVPIVRIAGGKIPLINTWAIIQGRCQDTQGRTVFGMNVYPISHIGGTTSVTAGVPANSKISGTARLSPQSVVGKVNSATTMPTSGEFRIEGIQCPPSSSGSLLFDVVA